ncbi:MAG: DUF971 domain-containing protein [Comamonadaceae bacterium]|nr:DUF971 domain-containing protein [Comamonadaceae bacterium]
MVWKATPQPSELRLKNQGKLLVVSFEDGRSFDLEAEYLRVESPSAEVQGHSPMEKRTVGGKKNVAILRIEPVGNYAVKITFDDGHDTGIYAWDTFVELGSRKDEIWGAYLDALKAKGLSREA